jgi:hypothetical protein
MTRLLNLPEYHYSIQYPAQWTYADAGEGVVIFKGKTIDGSQKISVNIQTIATKLNGGHYATVKALMDDFWNQVPKHAEKVRFVERGAIELAGSDGEVLKGEQTEVMFFVKGKMLKHWQVMVMSPDRMLFQTWAFRTTVGEFEENREIGGEMLESWKIT